MNDGKQQSTFLFHDYETLGTHPVLDRPVRFATIRTDSEFNVIGEPEAFYCRPTDDCLPQPGAVSVTGITPQETRAKGEDEAAFVACIHSLSTIPRVCILGYNNVRSDGEVIRDVLYRNFYDSYAWSWQHSNSRRNLLDVMHACYTPRPKGVNWPENDDGLPSFRFEHLTKANGIEYSNAHGAIVDVYATIAMARLVKTRQSRLSDYLFIHRNEYKLVASIDVPQMKLLVHASGVPGAWHSNISWVAPLVWYPGSYSAVIMVDLTGGISSLPELDSDTLREYLYTAEADLGDNAVAPVKLVHTNKCLVLAQANILRLEDVDRLGISRQHRPDNLKVLRENPQICEKVVTMLAKAESLMPSKNVDAQLCNGFLGDADRVAMKIALETEPRNLPALDIIFVDKRIEKLLFNYQAHSFPGVPDYTKQQRWLEHRRQVFTSEFLQGYADELQMLAQQYADDKEKVALLKALQQYVEEIV